MGRITFQVREIDTVSLVTARVLDSFATQALIAESDQGYTFSGDGQVNPGPVCSPVAFLINSVSLADIDSGGFFNVTVVDANGVSQGVVSELTSYGVKVTVPAASGGSQIYDVTVNGQASGTINFDGTDQTVNIFISKNP